MSTALAFESPLPIFVGLDGLPLTGGSVYFGAPNTDPRTNPIVVYYNEGMTIVAQQPLRTALGYLYRNGAPTNVWVGESCSVMVLDAMGRQVFYVPEWVGRSAANIEFTQTGADAVSRGAQDKMRDWVDAFDFNGGDVGERINAALAAGHKYVRVKGGSYTLASQILANALSDIVLDLRAADITAEDGLDVSLIRLISCIRPVVMLKKLNGNRAGQGASSFGIDLNGCTAPVLLGGRVTNCKDYGVYNIGSSYAYICGVTADTNGQAGFAGDVGGADVRGVTLRDLVAYGNGLNGAGPLNGLHYEGNPTTGFYYKQLTIDGFVSYDNVNSGVTLQNIRGFSLRNIKARNNGAGGIAMSAVRDGTGGDFLLEDNDQNGTPGYQSGLVIDDAAVTPISQNNHFVGVTTRGHAEYGVLERGNADSNSIRDLDSSGDAVAYSTVGASSVVTLFSGKTGGQGAQVGYGVAAGGTVTQATSKATGVTLDKLSGRITVSNAALAAGASVSFVWTNAKMADTDTVVSNIVSGATPFAYTLEFLPANGSCTVLIKNLTAGSLSQGFTFSFNVIKGSVT